MPEEVLERNIYVADKAEQRIVRSSAEVEREIWRLIQEVLNDFDTKGGKFVSDETVKQLLASLNKKLRGLIEETKFYDNISEFLHDFDQIEANLKAAHQSLNDITIANKVLSSQKDWAIENTTRFLRQAQINVKFIEPVKRALYTRVNYGASVTKTEEYLRQMILGTDKKNGILTRWVGQVARDTINQYEGVINQQIKVTYGMDATKYVGPILLDSRAQCVRWVGMGIIPDSSLESELEWARKNGAGLIPDTDISNFCIYRGGYNCVHTGYPTFSPRKASPPKEKEPEKIEVFEVPKFSSMMANAEPQVEVAKKYWENELLKNTEAVAYIKGYTANFYKYVNSYLRTGSTGNEKAKVETVQKSISGVTEALLNAPKFKGVVARGERYKTIEERDRQLEMYVPGNIVVNSGFTSTTRMTMLRDFSGIDAPGVNFFIKGKSGVSIEALSSFEEYEVLFPPGTQFLCVKKETDKKGLVHIYLEER